MKHLSGFCCAVGSRGASHKPQVVTLSLRRIRYVRLPANLQNKVTQTSIALRHLSPWASLMAVFLGRHLRDDVAR